MNLVATSLRVNYFQVAQGHFILFSANFREGAIQMRKNHFILGKAGT